MIRKAESIQNYRGMFSPENSCAVMEERRSVSISPKRTRELRCSSSLFLQPFVRELPGPAALPHPRSARRIALGRGNVTRRADATRSATKRARARADHPDAKSTNGNKILQNDIRLNRARSTVHPYLQELSAEAPA